MDRNLRRGMSEFGGIPEPPPSNEFVMPMDVDYGPGDDVYEAIMNHFESEVWNGLDTEAQLSVISSLEEIYPPETAGEAIPAELPFAPRKGRPRV
jgi:hypothetical protein